jgi:hypothetical protein
MSQQQFSDTLKDCLWKAHRKRCFYCEKPVTFIDFEIDHLIPESLLEKPKELKEIRTKYGLNDSFEIKGNYNLAPSCGSCNRKKADKLLPIGQVAILLETISSKLEKIKECLTKKSKQHNLGSILLGIGKAIDNKIFNKEELLAALEKKGYLQLSGNSILAIPSIDIDRELRNLSFSMNDKEIRFSYHSFTRLSERNILIEEVIGGLQEGVQVNKIELNKETKRYTYSILTSNEINIIFEIDGEKLDIKTAY